MYKKIAVVTASGIGDGLILHILSHHLVQMDHEVVTYNDHLSSFGVWLSGYGFAKQPTLAEIPTLFASYDAVILQHDNTAKAIAIHALSLPVYTLYGSHSDSKHGPLQNTDFACNPNRSMVENIYAACLQWFGSTSEGNGLIPPQGLIHRKYPRRVAIHPTSSEKNRNWPWRKFDLVAKKLQNLGYHPIFLVEQGDRHWLSSLEALASFLYESGAFLGNDSGPGHLASYLNIPSLILGKNEKHLRLWRPGWRPAEVITPPRWSSYWKGSRERWQWFISTRRVVKNLTLKVLKEQIGSAS